MTIETKEEIYLPPGCSVLSSQPHEQQIRLGLQAEPFNGKTYAAMSFPGIKYVISYDQKLGAFAARNDIVEVPFWNGAWVDSIYKRDGISCPPNRKDALLVWLNREGQKIQKGDTIVLDGSTGIETAFHQQYNLNPQVTKTGEVDGFAEWRQKEIHFDELWQTLKGLKSHVVYICHETPDRDKKGELNGKIRPMLTGKTGDKIASNFTDWFRVHAIAKPNTEELVKRFMTAFKLDMTSYSEWMASGTESTVYLFQTQSDEKASCGTSTLEGAPKFILANYNSIVKYRRKQTT